MIFQVWSRQAAGAPPPPPRPPRFPHEQEIVARVVAVLLVTVTLFFLHALLRLDAVFLAIPVLSSLATTQRAHMRRNDPLSLFAGTRAYLILTAGLAFVYYGGITAGQLVVHQNPKLPPILLITTTLAWAIIFEPLRRSAQTLIERRFNVRDRQSHEAVAAFTATLRQEIDLDQLREQFLTVIQRTLQPYSVSCWLCVAAKPPIEAPEQICVADDDSLLRHVSQHPDPLEVDRLPAASPLAHELRCQAAQLLAPLVSQGELLGLLVLGPRQTGAPYTRDERALLQRLAPQVAPALRVAQMVREQQALVRERERSEQELRTARDIQRAFLPKALPSLPGWQFTPYYRPARAVGGDFYDFLRIAKDRWGLVIGDVTDKGVPAALVMATVQTMLRSTAPDLSGPGEILARVNALLASELPPGMFVTCFLAVLDPVSGRLQFANAGHEPPFHCREGSATKLWATGMPLGLMPDTCYDEQTIALAPGDQLLFYTDGVVEAHNGQRAMFGMPRLQEMLTGHAGGTSLLDVVLGELAHFTGAGWEQEDDITLLVMRRC